MVSRYLLFGALCALAQPCLAAEPIKTIDAPAEANAVDDAYSNRVDFAWGVALTSNYLSAGETQSGDRPALQAYGEISSGVVYSGVWFSTVKLDPDFNEFDLYFGIRPEFGPLSFDFNYTRYVYDETGDCCGDWIAKAAFQASDILTLKSEFDYDPESRTRKAKAGLALALAEKLEFSTEFAENLESHDSYWNVGLKWQATDTVSLDLRYYDSDLFPERYVATLAYDFSTAN